MESPRTTGEAARVRVSEMENPQILEEESALSAAWEWGNLLDFSIDDDPSMILSWNSDDRIDQIEDPVPFVLPEPENPGLDRVRKRDPRVTCENFLAGRVPCSCPEEDEKDEEEEGIGRKRVRTGAASSATARCQVPGCEVDISELKGYHRRHRVCLKCANASSVVLDGQHKRYCQQCGKFHILPDFDEGKRSCRRKLEKHNNRRRRKSTDSRVAVEKEPQGNIPADDVSCDGEVGKEMLNGVASATESLCLTNQLIDTEPLLESEDGHGSPLCSIPSLQNSVTSSIASGKTQIEGRKDHPNSTLSSLFCDNKISYSSVCPTGRISFKLYDWNPAEFPRRLRHQIFEWLASMPVELEGYIRPGCTILTAFIAMPQFMWEKLSEDAASYINDLVKSPESLLSGRGIMFVYLNNLMFRVLNDGTSLINNSIDVRVPRLHYVHPTCFEAGKPMEFVACGSNLFRPKLRFLVSFAGKYLVYESCLSIHHGKSRSCDGITRESVHSSEHEIFKIFIPHTESKLFGPAFIEVENDSGLSNFVPVLFGDRQICSELQIIQQRFDDSLCSKNIGTGIVNTDTLPDSCEFFVSRQTAISELVLDIAWLLKEPQLDKNANLRTKTETQRLNCLLDFLIHNESFAILGGVLESLKVVLDTDVLCNSVDKIYDADMRLFCKHMNHARKILHQNLVGNMASQGVLLPKSDIKSDILYIVPNTIQNLVGNMASQGVLLPKSDIKSDILYIVPNTIQHMEMKKEDVLQLPGSSASQECGIASPLINKDIIMNVNCWQPKAYGHTFSHTIRRKPMALLILTTVVCCGVCVALSHPHKVGEFTVYVQRCLFGTSKT
ncbi:squamosa promoter binding protein-like 7 [Tasmannia lanceolata]|uniref:squamosa promoter binding protein-like 7 n=1 Tax=Tasmannia lanceolata TaxID=3420 RepID=UPI004064AE2A